MQLPNSIPVKELRYHNPAYNAEKLKLYAAIYDGGDSFRNNIDEFLKKRPIEQSADGAKLYTNRKAKAFYIPLISGIIDLIVGSEYKSKLSLEVNDPSQPVAVPGAAPAQQPEPTPEAKFYEDLGNDVDGSGTDLQALFKQASYEMKLGGGGAFGLTYSAPEGELEQPSIRVIPAEMLDHWEYDDAGQLLWVRTATTSLKTAPDAAPWVEPSLESTRWTIYTADQIATYEYTKKAKEPDADNALATLVGNIAEHEFGCVPVFPIGRVKGAWLLDRVYELCLALFNRQVSLTYALDTLTYSMLVYKRNPDNADGLKSAFSSDLGVVGIQVNESLEHEAPDPAIVSNAFQDETRLKGELYEALNSVAVNAIANQTQNARQGVLAKSVDLNPWQVLLTSYVAPVEDAFEQLLDALKRYRGEDELDVTIKGLYEFGGSLDDVKQLLAPAPTGQAATMVNAGASKAGGLNEDNTMSAYGPGLGNMSRSQADNAPGQSRPVINNL